LAPPWSSAASRNRRRAESMSLPSTALAASAAGGSARTTNVQPGRTVPNRSRTTCRSRRATRWRTTELPTALLTTNPTRGTPSTSASSAELPAPKPATSSAVMACTTSRGRPARRPRLVTSRKLSLPVSRLDAGSKRLRRTVLCDPCDDVPRGSPDLHGCACAGGTRGSAHGGGCWAGKYACSRSDLPVLARQVRLVPGPWRRPGQSFGFTGGRHAKLTHTGGRPYETTHPRIARPNRVPLAVRWTPLGDTPDTERCLPTAASCGMAQRLLACVLLVGQMGVGALLSRVRYVGLRWLPLRYAVPSCTVVDNPVDAARVQAVSDAAGGGSTARGRSW